jgi:hypothetical protein
MKRLIGVLFVLVWLVAASHASAQNRVKVEVQHEGKDTVGRQVATAVRDEIAKSPRFQLVSDGSALIDINLISLDIDPDVAARSGNRSALSALYRVWHVRGDHLDQRVTNVLHIVGVNRVDEVARDVLADMDAFLQKTVDRQD